MDQQNPGQAADRHLQWILTLLPAFPLGLLVLRLWMLSRQDMQTMLVLVHDASPLGLISALFITLVWVLPMVLLVGYALSALWLVSAPLDAEPYRSWLARARRRTPGWVVALAVVLAALTWQMRFLPILVMVTLAIVGLTVRYRCPDRPQLVTGVCVWLPVGVAVLSYFWLGPGILEAFDNGETRNALLLLLPPGLTVLLTGPVPASAARVLTQWSAAGAAVLAPFVVGALFLRVPVLPLVAIEIEADSQRQVLRGHVVTVDDPMTTLLDETGAVLFIPNETIMSKTLCPDSEQIPYSTTYVRGWHLELTTWEWVVPSQPPRPEDQRCHGRPLAPGQGVTEAGPPASP